MTALALLTRRLVSACLAAEVAKQDLREANSVAKGAFPLSSAAVKELSNFSPRLWISLAAQNNNLRCLSTVS